MQDPEKDASKTVIEGEAIVRPSSKKASKRNRNKKTDNKGHAQSETVSQDSAEFSSHTSNGSKNKQNNLNRHGALFSLSNLVGIFLFALALITGGFWLLNDLLFLSPESRKASTNIEEVTERFLRTDSRLAELQEQIISLETKIDKFVEYNEAQTLDIPPQGLLTQLKQLEERLDKIQNEVSRPKVDSVEKLVNTDFNYQQAIQLLDSLWLDSQTGKSLTNYPTIIDKLKLFFVSDKPSYNLLRSMDRALKGELSSHLHLLNELKQQFTLSVMPIRASEKIAGPAIRSEIKTERITDKNRSGDVSWIHYFARLVNLKKISEENYLGPDNENNLEIIANEADSDFLSNRKEISLDSISELPATLTEAIVYVTEILDNDELELDPEQGAKFNMRLSKFKSRQKTDETIDELYRRSKMISVRGEP